MYCCTPALHWHPRNVFKFSWRSNSGKVVKYVNMYWAYQSLENLKSHSRGPRHCVSVRDDLGPILVAGHSGCNRVTVDNIIVVVLPFCRSLDLRSSSFWIIKIYLFIFILCMQSLIISRLHARLHLEIYACAFRLAVSAPDYFFKWRTKLTSNSCRTVFYHILMHSWFSLFTTFIFVLLVARAMLWLVSSLFRTALDNQFLSFWIIIAFCTKCYSNRFLQKLVQTSPRQHLSPPSWSQRLILVIISFIRNILPSFPRTHPAWVCSCI